MQSLEDTVAFDGWVLSIDGVKYDFSDFDELGEMTKTAMRFIWKTQSTNDNLNSRRRSNTSVYKTVKSFLQFVKNREYLGRQYSQRTLLEYQRFQQDSTRPLSAHSRVSKTRGLFKYAMAHEGAGQFRLPPAMHQGAALSTSRGSETVADHLSATSKASSGGSELNSHFLRQLEDFCWQRVHEVRDRWDQSVAWREDADPKHYAALPSRPRSIDRNELLRLLVLYLWSVNDGYMPQRRNDRSALTPEQLQEDGISRRFREYLRRHCFSITMNELADYMKPSHRQIACFLPLFALKGINPVSIFELEVNMLVSSPTESETMMIRWEKQRANRERVAGPWKVKGVNSRTIPRAWEILMRVTSSIRQDAQGSYRKYLFLASRHHVSDKSGASVAPLKPSVTMKIFNKMLQEASPDRWPLLSNTNVPLSLKMIRTTAGSVKRFTGGLAEAQRHFQHEDTQTTESYLKSPMYKTMLDELIKRGQASLLDHLTKRPTIISSDAAEIVKTEGLSHDEASALVREEYNTGFGVSLFKERAFVVDTPLNYLRMRGWLENILKCKERLVIQNPDRWKGYWAAQINLFQAALDDFPRKTIQASRRLSVDLSFPEPY